MTTEPQELEFKDNNKTQELKDILEKVTSLTADETNILKAMVELSKRLEE